MVSTAPMRHTKITCTIGPSIAVGGNVGEDDPGGMNVARLNMSHATHEWTRAVFQRIRAASETAGDSLRHHDGHARPRDSHRGPAYSAGIEAGDIFEFTVKGAQSEEEKSVDVNFPNLVKDIHEGDTVLVDNGVIRLTGVAEAASADAM